MADLTHLSNKNYCIGKRSAGAALLSLLQALGVDGGDAVFLPALAPDYILNGVLCSGAVPVFCDITGKNMCLSPKSLKKALQKCVQEKKLEPRAVLIYDFCGFMPDFKALSALCSAEGLLTVEICQNALPKGDCDIALSAVKTPEVCAGLIFTDIKRAAENLIRIEKSDPMGIGAPLLDFELEKATEHLSLVPRKRASRRQKALRLAEKYAEKGLVPAFDFSDKSFGYNGFPFFAENAEHKLSLTELSKARFYSPACAVRGLSTAGGREEFPSAFAAADRLVVFELFQGN